MKSKWVQSSPNSTTTLIICSWKTLTLLTWNAKRDGVLRNSALSQESHPQNSRRTQVPPTTAPKTSLSFKRQRSIRLVSDAIQVTPITWLCITRHPSLSAPADICLKVRETPQLASISRAGVSRKKAGCLNHPNASAKMRLMTLGSTLGAKCHQNTGRPPLRTSARLRETWSLGKAFSKINGLALSVRNYTMQYYDLSEIKLHQFN